MSLFTLCCQAKPNNENPSAPLHFSEAVPISQLSLSLQSLVDAHDGIARKVYVEEEPLTTIKTNVNGIPSGEPIRMVGLHKSPREPLVGTPVALK